MDIKFAVLCDYVIVSREGKLSVLGITDLILTPTFPAIVGQLALVASFSATEFEFGSERTIECTVVDEDGTEVGKLTSPVRLPRPEHSIQSITVNITLNFQGLSFPHEGKYVFDISVDGAQKKDIGLDVRPLPA